jgi:nucleotide-binding universal stress UspA family protein
MRILVATDGSRAGRAAVRFADRLASDRNHLRRLTIVTVEEAAGRDAAERALADAARQLRGRPARYLRIPSPAGGVPEAISRAADRVGADLVVVGSEGRDSLQEWVVGGTALRLIYVARRPVTVVRAPRRRGGGRAPRRVLR